MEKRTKMDTMINLKNVTVLYVEDEISISEEVDFLLSTKVKKVYVASNGIEGLELFKEHKPDIIVSDIEMPKMNGLDMIAEIKKEDTDTPIIVTSAFSETDKLLKAIELKVDAYLLKPINLKELLQKIETFTRTKFLEKELAEKRILEIKEKELSAYKERMDLAFSGSNDALWDWNILTNEVYLSERWKNIIGYKADEIEHTLDSSFATVYAEDIPKIEKALEEVSQQKKEFYEVEFRQRHKDGHLVWVLARGKMAFDKNGNKVRMIGTHTDITEKKEAQQKLLQNQECLSNAQKIAKLGNWKWDPLSNKMTWSSEIYRILGEQQKAFEPSFDSFLNYVHKDDIHNLKQIIQKSLADKKKLVKTTHRIVTKNKYIRYVQEIADISYDSNGTPIQVIGTMHDITELYNEQNRALKYQRLLELAAEVSSMAFWEFDMKDNIFHFNDLYYKFLATDVQQEKGYVKSVNEYFNDFVPYKSQKTVIETIKKAYTQKNDYSFYFEYQMIRRDGVILDVGVDGYMSYDTQGNPEWCYGTKYNLSRQKEIQKALIKQKEQTESLLEEQKRLSITDDMTQLYNRRFFNETFEKEINRATREHKALAFLMLDIDYFKSYNDYYGHYSGDKILISVAIILKEFANRAGDNAFRLGGEEFGLILSAKSKEHTIIHAQKLIQAIEDLMIPHEKNTVSSFLTASAGLVFRDADSNLNFKELYTKADNALYQAKRNGRNQVVFK